MLKLFQKIEVTESTKQTKPGSIGYISSISERGPYNSAAIRTMFTRFGKSGRNRFSLVQINVPLVNMNELHISENNKNKLEELYAREMQPRRPRIKTYDSKMEIISEKSKDLTSIDTWDFMAYISAISIFLGNNGIYYNNRARYGNRMYNNRNLNNARNNEVEVKANNIGSIIYNMFISKDLHPKLEEYVIYFNDVNNRKMWLNVLRREISVYKQIITRHNQSILNRYKSTHETIRQIAKNNGISVRKFSEKDLI